MHWVILHSPPIDADTFLQVPRNHSGLWRHKIADALSRKNKIALQECSFRDVLAVDQVCEDHNYVVLLKTDSQSGVTAWFRPERRQRERLLPIERSQQRSA